MSNDLTFFTNEPGKSLLDRFRVTLEHNTRFFDVLVGYFKTSGFFRIYESLEKTEKVRILVGISLNKKAHELIKQSEEGKQLSIRFSHSEAKEDYKTEVVTEMEKAEDKQEVQDGVKKFIEWIQSGKLEIRVYPKDTIHAKVYIMTFGEGDRDKGRVITGSSNFTEAGLVDNLEFNVELKDRSDYDFALHKFNELWGKSVPVSEEYVETIKTKTWLNDTITPYELYLKFLYEYFGEKISITPEDMPTNYLPDDFVEYQYQKDAVADAKSKLLEYGGVFLSDVVGLGKTYISALLAQQLDGKHLVIAPPALLDEKNPGSWTNVFRDFGVRGTYFKSIGKLDDIIEKGTDKYDNVFIDEAHRFRTQNTESYEKLAQICRGKKVILVSATPLNNSPKDILSQLKLFQNARNSTLPNPKVRDLEGFFNTLHGKLKTLNRNENYDDFIETTKENAKAIRENVLKHLMVRRTRSEIVKYYKNDLKKQGLRFPEVADPKQVYYKLDSHLDEVFNKTVKLITSKDFSYSRYTPLLYLQGDISQPVKLSQQNMSKFMKILLVKRLDSSFHAFKKTLKRFIDSYDAFIREFENGRVFISKKHTNKIFDFLDDDDEESVFRLVEEKKAEEHKSDEFNDKFKTDLEKDREILRQVNEMWSGIDKDPKLDEFKSILKTDDILKKNKLIVFTESKETADYLKEHLSQSFGDIVLGFSGSSGADMREKVIKNFDAKARFPKDDYRILITTEVLAEGVNLHRSNVVINYDIPWNPTRVIQRVGRINRVDTKFDKIYTYNFFPTAQTEGEIGLETAAKAKINAFIEMLGSDAKLLTDSEPIVSHGIFDILKDKTTYTGEDENEDSELRYLNIIKDVRDQNRDLFERIKNLPKKARTARKRPKDGSGVITFFRKKNLRKMFVSMNDASQEVDFFKTAEMLSATPETPKETIPKDFFDFLELNKKEFELETKDEKRHLKARGSMSYESKLMHTLKAIKASCKGFVEEDEDYINKLLKKLEDSAIPTQTAEKVVKAIKGMQDEIKIYNTIKKNIPTDFFKPHLSESSAETSGPREIILSEYLIGE